MLNIDKLRYDIYKKCEKCFMELLEGVYCYRDIKYRGINEIQWKKGNKRYMEQSEDILYIDEKLIWIPFRESHMMVTEKCTSSNYKIIQLMIKRIMENNFQLGHLIPHVIKLY